MFERLDQAFRASSLGRWYAVKDDNEQRILVGLTILVVVLVIWAGVWKPISDWQTLEAFRYRNNLATLEWLRAQEGSARQSARSSQGAGGRRSLLPVISRSAETLGVRLARFQPESGGGVSVVVQNQPFDDVVRWLHALETNNQVGVVQATIDAETTGYVNARFTLR